MIRLKDIEKVLFGDQIQTTVVDGVDLQIDKGEFVLILGPSGSGKTSLLNIIGLLESPTAGEYWFEGEEVSSFSEKKRSAFRKGVFGFVFQRFNLIDELTLFENIELPLVYDKVPKDERVEIVNEIMQQMDIADKRDFFPQQVSGSQQQKTAIGRAIVTNPKVILADEPTGNLNSLSGVEVMDKLVELNNIGTTIVMVTHTQEYSKYAHRVIRILDGAIVS